MSAEHFFQAFPCRKLFEVCFFWFTLSLYSRFFVISGGGTVHEKDIVLFTHTSIATNSVFYEATNSVLYEATKSFFKKQQMVCF